MTSRLRRVSLNSILLLASVGLCLGLGEVATRLGSDVRPPVWRPHPVLGKTYVPSFRGTVYNDESGREIFLRFNREGFRGEDLPYAKPFGTRRIAVVGDSFIAAMACDEEGTVSSQLEAALGASDPSARWQVQNFGVSGSSTGQELVLYREVVSRYDPDIVVCAYSLRNDFTDNSRRTSSGPRIYFDLDGEGKLVESRWHAHRSRLSAWLNEHSRLYVWWKRANEILKGRASPVEQGRVVFCSKETPETDAVWELNQRLIEAFRDDVERRGGRFVLAILPCAEQVNDDIWRDVLEGAGAMAPHYDPYYPERRLQTFCRDRGIETLAMTREFEAAARRGERLFFRTGGHFNEAGSRLAARLLYRHLTEPPGNPPIEARSRS